MRATYNLNKRKSSWCTTLRKIRVWSTLIASFPLSTLSYKENLILVILIKKPVCPKPAKMLWIKTAIGSSSPVPVCWFCVGGTRGREACPGREARPGSLVVDLDDGPPISYNLKGFKFFGIQQNLRITASWGVRWTATPRCSKCLRKESRKRRILEKNNFSNCNLPQNNKPENHQMDSHLPESLHQMVA